MARIRNGVSEQQKAARTDEYYLNEMTGRYKKRIPKAEIPNEIKKMAISLVCQVRENGEFCDTESKDILLNYYKLKNALMYIEHKKGVRVTIAMIDSIVRGDADPYAGDFEENDLSDFEDGSGEDSEPDEIPETIPHISPEPMMPEPEDIFVPMADLYDEGMPIPILYLEAVFSDTRAYSEEPEKKSEIVIPGWRLIENGNTESSAENSGDFVGEGAHFRKSKRHNRKTIKARKEAKEEEPEGGSEIRATTSIQPKIEELQKETMENRKLFVAYHGERGVPVLGVYTNREIAVLVSDAIGGRVIELGMILNQLPAWYTKREPLIEEEDEEEEYKESDEYV